MLMNKEESKYPRLTIDKLPGNFEFIEGERASGKHWALRLLEEQKREEAFKKAIEETGFYLKVRAPISPMNVKLENIEIDSISEEEQRFNEAVSSEKNFEELIDEGFSFVETNAILRERGNYYD